MSNREKLFIAFIIFVAALFVCLVVARAQDPKLTPYQITSTQPCTGHMDTSASGQATYCFGTDGAFVSLNGASPVQFAPPATAGAITLTLNGVQKTLPNSFTLSSAAPTIAAPTASAPAITAQ